ncbi:ABC-2 type transport system ATP-binding protein [Haloechinothrix alba]|uniref:ABC-2 type transport system ATP-binding protein n=1 Tax=Haloechinothrix alba TaxID=664784 RepID=A0A238WLH2_9PSEU|nr:ABC transporter ATP-binding protein [Haloechinothrix alba]SNR46539.1 ABC-2 type transport system ATP-binding protein [Haloechinothrix alba]
MMNYSVAVDRLHVERGGREVVRGVSFGVEPGTVTGLLGPSGCGKSTLMRSVVGVQIIRAGRVTVLGHDAGTRAVRGRVGYATQDPAIYPDLTVAEALRYFADIVRAPASDVSRVIGEVGLRDHADALIGRLSGGQHSRANLAVALLGDPEVLVLDEPTVGLDPVLRDELWELFTRLAAAGTTLLVSSHVMDEAARCHRLLLMRDGALLASDTPQRLRERTGESDLERAFLRLIQEVTT